MEIATHRNVQNDIKILRSYGEKFEEVCDKATSGLKDHRVACSHSEIVEEAHRVIQTIEALGEMQPAPQSTSTSREKRDIGMVHKLWNFLFGTDDATDGLAGTKSIGVLTHSVQAFKDVERQIEHKTDNVYNQVKWAINQINTESEKCLDAVDINAVNIRIAEVHNTILENIRRMSRFYTDLGHAQIDVDEIRKMVDGINKNVEDCHVPKIETRQLKKLITIEPLVRGLEVKILVSIPVVSKDKFQKFYVVAMPRNDSNLISDVEPQEIVVSQTLLQYIKPVQLTDINETLAITAETVNVFERFHEADNCVIATIMMKKGICKTKNLPEVYDVWLETPMHNVVAFYSNLRKEMICPAGREEISIKAGIVALQSGCWIETAQHNVKPSKDKSSIKKSAYKFDVDVQEVPLFDVTRHESHIEDMKGISAINDQALDNVLAEAAAEQGLPLWGVVVISIASTAVSIIVIVVIICWRCTSRRRVAYNVGEVIELNDLSQKDDKKKTTSSLDEFNNQTD